MVQLLILSILFIQILFGFFNYKWNIGIMVFILVVTPNELSLSPTSDISLIKLSVLISLFTIIFYYRNITSKNLKVYFTPIVIFSLLLMPTYFFVGDYGNIFVRFFRFFFTFFVYDFLPGIVIWLFIKDEKDFYFILRIAIFSVFVIVTFGVFEYILGFNPFLDWIKSIKSADQIIIEYSRDSNLKDALRFGFNRRLQSTAWHPIAYGGCLAMYIILFFLFYSYKRKKYTYVLIAITLFNIALTLSRAPWFVTILGITILGIMNYKKRLVQNAGIKFFALSFIFVMIVFLIYALIDFLGSTEYGGSSLEMRISQLEYLFILIKTHLLFGFGQNAVNHFLSLGSSADMHGFESIIFIYFFNFGLVGLFAISFVYFSSFINMVKGGHTYYSVYFVVIFISHVIFSILSGEIRTFRIFWLIYSMLFAIHNIEKNKSKGTKLQYSNLNN